MLLSFVQRQRSCGDRAALCWPRFDALFLLILFALFGCGTNTNGPGTLEKPVLALNAIAPVPYGVTPFHVAATSSSPAAITYQVLSGPGTIVGDLFTTSGVGAVELRASQSATGDYAAAEATTSITVLPANPGLSFNLISACVFGDPPISLAAHSKSSGLITYSVVSGAGRTAGNMLSVLGAGTIVVSATQAADANYTAQSASLTIPVGKATPSITFTPVSSKVFGDAPFPLQAQSASTGAITFGLISGPGTLAGSVASITGAGTLVFSARQDADQNYQPQQAQYTVQVGHGPVLITPASVTVQAGDTTVFAVTQDGVGISNGTWSVLGGTSNGIIDSNGTYHSPVAAPSPNTVTVNYTQNGSQANAIAAIVNPMPSIVSVIPNILTQSSASLTIVGTHFEPGSTVSFNGSSIPTSFIDTSHLTVQVGLTRTVSSSVPLSVANPLPGGGESADFSLPVAIQPISVQPAMLSGGPVTLALSGPGFSSNSVVLLDGVTLNTSLGQNGVLLAQGYLPPWRSGSSVVSFAPNASVSPAVVATLPIQATPVSYDMAARFSTQAAFGPRPDLVQHIQTIGLSSFIDEQIQQPLYQYSYNSAFGPREDLILTATQGNSLLRLRTALALETFIVSQNLNPYTTMIPYEQMIERNALGNFRNLLTDMTGDASLARLLNLAGNKASTDPTVHPNQNFARELLQLFSIGQTLLMDDGSTQINADGNPVAAYDQSTILDLSRVLTGWDYPAPVTPASTYAGIDFALPLTSTAANHDNGAKVLFGNQAIAAGLSPEEDRAQALDIIFNHPNVPPFVCRRLIQHLVKSNPSPAYIARASKVFENDGSGVRGNMAAVVKAILLDPEARSGDLSAGSTDGFLQDPLLSLTFSMSLLQIQPSDSTPSYEPGMLGEDFWSAPTVFGFLSPDYMIPGTSINSPEFQIFNNLSLIQRTQMLWGIINTSIGGFTNDNSSAWLFTQFPTVPSIVEALNHIAYHGTMSASVQTTIVNYCSQLSNSSNLDKLKTAVFLALNSDSYNVSH